MAGTISSALGSESMVLTTIILPPIAAKIELKPSPAAMNQQVIEVALSVSARDSTILLLSFLLAAAYTRAASAPIPEPLLDTKASVGEVGVPVCYCLSES